MSLRFTFMKALKSSIRLHWWPFPKMHDALSTHVFTKSRRKWNGTILLFVEESYFFKWFNYADSGAIIIRYISLQQQQKKRNFFSQKWKFCWIYGSTKFFELWIKMTIRNYKTFQVSFRFCSFVTNERHFVT